MYCEGPVETSRGPWLVRINLMGPAADQPQSEGTDQPQSQLQTGTWHFMLRASAPAHSYSRYGLSCFAVEYDNASLWIGWSHSGCLRNGTVVLARLLHSHDSSQVTTCRVRHQGSNSYGLLAYGTFESLQYASPAQIGRALSNMRKSSHICPSGSRGEQRLTLFQSIDRPGNSRFRSTGPSGSAVYFFRDFGHMSRGANRIILLCMLDVVRDVNQKKIRTVRHFGEILEKCGIGSTKCVDEGPRSLKPIPKRFI